MGAYQTVAVGTDGSESSFRAVDKAATIAGDAGATLLIISAYHPQKPDSDSDHALGEESAYMVVGSAPAEQALTRAKERALKASSDVKVDTLAVEGNPVEVVIKVTSDRKAELAAAGVKMADYQMLIIPGGSSPDHMRRDEHMVRLARVSA